MARWRECRTWSYGYQQGANLSEIDDWTTVDVIDRRGVAKPTSQHSHCSSTAPLASWLISRVSITGWCRLSRSWSVTSWWRRRDRAAVAQATSRRPGGRRSEWSELGPGRELGWAWSSQGGRSMESTDTNWQRRLSAYQYSLTDWSVVCRRPPALSVVHSTPIYSTSCLWVHCHNATAAAAAADEWWWWCSTMILSAQLLTAAQSPIHVYKYKYNKGFFYGRRPATRCP